MDTQKTYATGALIDRPDYRLIPAAAVLPALSKPTGLIETDMSNIPNWDQGQRGQCVPYARWKIVQALAYFETGTLPSYEPGYAYALDKQADGIAGEGTYPSIDDKNAMDYGCPTKDVLTLNSYLPLDQYIAFERTPEVIRSASRNAQTLPYVGVLPTVSAIRQALESCKLLAITAVCGQSWFAGIPPLAVPIDRSETHRTIIYRLETLPNGKTRADVYGSWGEGWAQGGNSWIILDDYIAQNAIFDIRGYYKVPQHIMDEVKRLPAVPRHTFTRSLSFGMTHPDVLALQDCLKSLGLMDITKPSTQFYGTLTQAGVLKFQIFCNIQSFASLVGLGGMNAGPKTLVALNKFFKRTRVLYEAIILAESIDKNHPEGNDNAIGDLNISEANGGHAYGCMQIRQPVCDDVNKAYGTNRKASDMLGNRPLSIDTFNKYMDIYCKGATDEKKARVWNGGPNGMNVPQTAAYWKRVQQYM